MKPDLLATVLFSKTRADTTLELVQLLASVKAGQREALSCLSCSTVTLNGLAPSDQAACNACTSLR